MAAITSRLLAWRDRLVALPVLDQDALLYLLADGSSPPGRSCSAVSDDYRQWAEMALGPYAAAVVLCFVAARRGSQKARRDEAPKKGDRLRNGIIIGLAITVMLVPLSVEVVLRAEHKPGDDVQNEVTVIEACGDRLMHHKNCYLPNPKWIGTSVTSQSENSFFPYLPGMIPFGLINATSGPAEFKDARLPLTGFSLVVHRLRRFWSWRRPVAAALAHVPGGRHPAERGPADGDRGRRPARDRSDVARPRSRARAEARSGPGLAMGVAGHPQIHGLAAA